MHTPLTGGVHGGANVDIDAVIATNSLVKLRKLCKELRLPIRNSAENRLLLTGELVAQLRALPPQRPVSDPVVAPSGAPAASVTW